LSWALLSNSMTPGRERLLPGYSVVVPVYNSAPVISLLTSRVRAVLERLGQPFELILVNDGSRDGSWNEIKELSVKYTWVRGLCMMRNYGQHNALLAGIRAARYDITITIDDDLQHPPEELPKLLVELTEDFDVIYGPPEVEQHGFLRDVASIITKVALKTAMGGEIARKVSALRVFRTQIRDAFVAYHSPFVSVDVLLTWGTSRFGAVKVRHEPRTQGKSNYSFRKLTLHALNMMTGFSVLPLQLGSIVGFTFTFLGFVVLSYVVGRYLLNGSSVSGFPFLASIIAIFSGAQLFALGILGEYLARIHFRTMDKPIYAVREATWEIT